MARSGRTIGEDPGLAWELVAALYTKARSSKHAKRWHGTNHALALQDEIRPWMQLHLGAAVAAEEARVMVDLANRQPGGNYRDAIVALLIAQRPAERSRAGWV